MNILQSWSHSMALCKASNLKLFLLVTLKSIIETYKLLFTIFLPVSVLIIPLFFLNGWGLFIAVLFFCLVIRPSVLKKDYKYLNTYAVHLVWYAAIILFLMLIFDPVRVSIASLGICLGYYVALTLILLLMFCILLAAPMAIYCIFFFLDSNGTFGAVLNSFTRALKMVMYTLPFVTITLIIFLIISFLFTYLIRMMSCPYSMLINIFFIMPSMLCFWNNLYIKNIHENFDLYFKRKEV